MFDEDRKSIKIEIEDADSLPSGAATAPKAGDEGATEEAPDMAEAIVLDRAAELERELAEEHERHLRAVAELQNFRRRTAEERAQQLQFANQQLVHELLPILDNFERATGCEVDSEAARSLLRGVCMILEQLREVLTRFGVERIATVGEFFDPARHEAVERVETKAVCEGTIVEEVLPGYTLNGRVVRPAKVKVAVDLH